MQLVVAWDGATFDLLDPLLSAGRMPVLASLIESGASMRLRSTVPAATFPAWTSFMTAATPGHHGVTDFTVRDGYGVRFVNASYRRLPTIWSILSEGGARVGVYGFPATYPPEAVNGIQVCGFDTPLGAGASARVTHPPELGAAIVRRYGSLAIDGPSQARIEPGWHERALARLLETIELKTRIVCDALREQRFDCFAVHFGESDTVCHQFWHLCDRESPRYERPEPGALGTAIEQVYRALDAGLGRLLEAAGDDADVMLLSDHGSGGTGDRVVFWNRWLAENGWLRFADDGVSAAAGALRRAALRWTPTRLQPALFSLFPAVAGRLESKARLGGIDWTRTRAFSEEVNYYPAIWLNLRGREPQGVVELSEADRVLEELSARLREFVDPFDGAPVVEAVARREQLFDGPWAGRAPDLVLALREPDGYSYACASSRGGAEAASIRRLRPAERSGARGSSMPGSHREDGLCVLRGRGVRAGGFPRADLAGAGATLLALAGSSAPAGADGQVWWHCFHDHAPGELRPCEAATRPSPGQDVAYSEAAEREVASKLRALGYMD